MIRSILCCAVVATAAAPSLAEKLTIEFEIQHSANFEGFGFSVLHTSNGSNPATGSIIERFHGTFVVQYDTVANSLTFLSFDATYEGGDGLTHMTLGSTATSPVLDLNGDPNASGGAFVGFGDDGNGNFTEGNGELSLNLTNRAGLALPNQDVPFMVQGANMNSMSNRFRIGGDPQDPNAEYTLGIWAAGTTDLFEGGPGPENTNNRIGIDLVGRGHLIPLPHPGALAGVGFLGLAAVRRRRSSV